MHVHGNLESYSQPKHASVRQNLFKEQVCGPRTTSLKTFELTPSMWIYTSIILAPHGRAAGLDKFVAPSSTARRRRRWLDAAARASRGDHRHAA